MRLPAIIIYPDGTRSLFQSRIGFADDVGTNHPAEAWEYWTAEDWATMCPRLLVRPVADPGAPTEEGKRAERLPVEQWAISDDAASVTYALRDLTPAEIEAAKPPVPASITNFQARAVLLQAGLFEQVNNTLLALPVASAARQAWEYANDLTRSGTLVNSVAVQLGLTVDDLDDLFRQAATIEA